MKRLKIITLISLTFVMVLPGSAFAQGPATGFPPFGSSDTTQFDGINLQNLNVNFGIPIVSSPGRNMNFALSLVNNSLLWTKNGTVWSPVTDQSGNPTWGWTKDIPGGTITYRAVNIQIKCFVDGTWYWDYRTNYSNYKYVDVMGTVHGFPTVSVTYNDCLDTQTGTTTGYAGDASGYYLNAGSPDSPYAISPGGIYSPGGTVVDTNGNYITKTVVSSTETDWTDSVGNVALKILYNYTASPPNIQYQFLDGTGSSSYKTITLKLQAMNIKTNFGCSLVTEYTSTGTVNLPVELDIPTPSGSILKYLFAYEPTPQNASYTTGRVQRVTLPTGGYYEYDYMGSNDGVNCADGSTLGLNRVMSDGTNTATWGFVRNTSNSTTTKTTPQLADTSSANDTVYTFNGTVQETSSLTYSNHPGTTGIRTVNTTWAANGTPATRVTILEDGTTKSEVDTSFDSNGNLLALTEYDWGTGAHGSTSPIRTTTMSYLGGTNYTSRNILNRMTEILIKDSQGTIQYRQDFGYDESALTVCPVGIPQHDDSGHPCSMNYRGNQTSVKTYLDPVTPANPVAKNFTYDWFGNLLTAEVNCCQQKTWSFSATTQYSQPDSVTSGPSGTQLTTGATYNHFTGQVATTTDENGQVTHFLYDFLRRLTSVQKPDGTTTTFNYDDTHFTNTRITPVDSGKSLQQITGLDSLGRPALATTEDGSNNIISNVSTNFDLAGRAYKHSNPYLGSPSYWTTTQFDALGRPLTITLPDTSATTYSYSKNTIVVTDAAGKQKQENLDAAGRLVMAGEPDPGTGMLTQQTAYSYSVLDALTTVTQDAQTRTFVYDALGRLISAATPETANIATRNQYNIYDLVVQRTDPRGVITTYGYDNLNRLQTVSYNVGSTGVPPTPGVTFTYGASAAQNNNGRLITITDGAGSENYSYDVLGRMTQLQKIVGTTTYTTTYQYNSASELTQITYPSGRVVQQAVDSIGRLCAIAQTASSCTTATNPYATNFQYNSASQLTGFSYGNSVAASFTFSPDRLQMTGLSYVKGAASLYSLNYWYKLDSSRCPNGTAGNNGQIQCIIDNIDSGRNIAYSYDALSRLTAATAVGSTAYPQWGLSFAYDRYGNRLTQSISAGCVSPMTCPTNSLTFSNSSGAKTNRPDGYGFDLNGNMTNDGSNTLTYDAENHFLTSTGTLGSGTYTYDGKGLRVKKVSGSATTVYIYSGPKVIAEYVNGAAPLSPTREYIYSGDKLLTKIEGGAAQYYHSDHLSVRLTTDSNGNKIGEQGHFPFGELWYANNTTSKWQFTTYERDSESGNDYAWARCHVNRLGRFSSADPLSGSLENPQSLNRYAYVTNDPIDLIDPSGQRCWLWTNYTWFPGGDVIGGGGWGLSGVDLFCIPDRNRPGDDAGGGGGGGGDGSGGKGTKKQPPACSFNVFVGPGSILGSAGLQAFQSELSRIFGEVGVGINPVASPSAADFTIGLAGAGSNTTESGSFTPGTNFGTVFVGNLLASNPTASDVQLGQAAGEAGAHEFGHFLFGSGGGPVHTVPRPGNLFESSVMKPAVNAFNERLSFPANLAGDIQAKCKKLHP
jgi:RHS repeat-associated protein